MRCTTARKIMIADLDGAASDVERERLAEHLGGCVACRHEDEEARRLTRAFAGLDAEVAVPATLEDAVLRRIRNLEDDGPALAERLRRWFPTPVVLAGAAVAMALVVVGVVDRRSGGDEQGLIALPRPVDVPPTQLASAETQSDDRTPVQVARAEAVVPPIEPPADLTASLPLLLDMPILRNMEKLENFERIEALTLADDGGTNG